MIRVLSIATIFAVGISSCKSDDEPAANITSSPVVKKNASKPRGRTLPPVGYGRPGKTAKISQGTIDVFGLRVPRGMTPTEGPHKVFRFEGTHHVSQVVNYIRGQVSSDRVEPEGNGYIFRYARVRYSKDKMSPDQSLAVRVYPRATGGSVLDIWEERELAKNLPARAPSFYKGAMARRHSRKTTLRSYKARQRRALKETMRPLAKLQSNERLESSDMNSPFFESE